MKRMINGKLPSRELFIKLPSRELFVKLPSIELFIKLPSRTSGNGKNSFHKNRIKNINNKPIRLAVAEVLEATALISYRRERLFDTLPSRASVNVVRQTSCGESVADLEATAEF